MLNDKELQEKEFKKLEKSYSKLQEKFNDQLNQKQETEKDL